MVEEVAGGKFERHVGARAMEDLPAGDVVVRVRFSALNYKDCLSATGHKGVTRRYPHTPGIDAAGEVVSSSASSVAVGSEVIVTGHDLGMNTAGGLAEYIRVPAGWVVPLPSGLTPREAMILGTAGLTAAQSVEAIQEGGIKADVGPILVTGATGGVGCLAVTLLAQAGYSVTGATGKGDRHGWLRELGAADVIVRDTILGPPDRPLLSGTWAGAVDTVGGAFLDAALRSSRRGGVVVACGLVASARLETNVYPFILRGVRLQGVDTAELSRAQRQRLWRKLAGVWRPATFDKIAHEIGLDDVSVWIGRMLAGQVVGRIVVKLGG